MPKTIHIELTKEEGLAHIRVHMIALAMLNGSFERAFARTQEILAEDMSQLSMSGTKKICRAIDPAAADHAEFVVGNYQAAKERRN